MTKTVLLKRRRFNNEEKHCNYCDKYLPFSEFNKTSATLSGYSVYCRECSKKKRAEPKNKIRDALSSSKKRVRTCYKEKNLEHTLTIEQITFIWERDKAHLLKKPSLDRIDNSKGYTLENCQFIELGINSNKDKIRTVQQIDKDGRIVAEYPSVPAAAEALGRYKGSILNVLRGHEKTAYGFIWKYKSDV